MNQVALSLCSRSMLSKTNYMSLVLIAAPTARYHSSYPILKENTIHCRKAKLYSSSITQK